MKRSLIIVVFVFFCMKSNKAFAQDTLNSTPQLALTILEKINHEVGLNEQQKEDVLTLLIERSKQIEKVKSKEERNRLSKESLATVNQEAYNHLQKILTEEQFTRLMALREETRKMKKRFPTEKVYQSDQDIVLDF